MPQTLSSQPPGPIASDCKLDRLAPGLVTQVRQVRKRAICWDASSPGDLYDG
jgi:hypothetical protein